MSTTMDFAELAQKSQEQFLETVGANQQAIVDAVSAWSRAVQAYAPATPPVPDLDGLPTAEQIIDNTFGLVEKLVASQREFARNLVAAAAPARAATTSARPTTSAAAPETPAPARKTSARKTSARARK